MRVPCMFAGIIFSVFYYALALLPPRGHCGLALQVGFNPNLSTASDTGPSLMVQLGLLGPGKKTLLVGALG